MFFLQINLILLFATMIWTVTRIVTKDLDAAAPARVAMMASMGSIVALSLGIRQSHHIAGGEWNWSVIVFAAVGLTWFGAYAWRSVRYIHQGNHRPHAVIIGIFACLGLYIFGTTVDHFIFIRPGFQGAIASEAIPGEKLQCEGMVMYRYDGDLTTYRCPRAIALSQLTVDPFIPWPEYISTTSATMKAEVEAFQDRAREDMRKLENLRTQSSDPASLPKAE